MNLRQAAQQALEALEWGSGTYDRRNAAITALKQALAEPEQGPVASVTRGKLSMIRGDIITFDGASIPLYAAPTPHKPQTTHWEGCEAVHPECRAIQRRPLTHEEIEALDNLPVCPSDAEVITFVRKIERAHGIGEQHE